MSFKDQMKQDAQTVFMNSGEFAEEITYTPAGQQAKILRAVVIRKTLEPGDENSGRTLRNQAEVYISCDTENGIVEINRSDDRITLTDIEGTVQESRISEILDNSGGMWHLLAGW